MIRLSLLLAVAGVTGVAAVSAHSAPAKTAPKSPAAAVTPAKTASELVSTAWLDRYGVYNAKTGTTSLVPVRFRAAATNGVQVGGEEGC